LLHVRTLLVAVTLLGCGAGASRAPSAGTPAPAADVTRATPSPCEEDEALCTFARFEDRSRFFEEVVGERARLERVCAHDEAACRALAESYGYHPLRVPPDRLRAAELYTALCEAEDMSACWSAASILLDRTDLSDAPARAAALLDRGCALGDPGLCYLAGVERLPNGGLPPDRARALTQLRAACEQGEAPACLSLLRGGAGGLIEALSPGTVDALLRAEDPDAVAPSSVVAASQTRCGRREGAAFYAPLLSALATLSPPASLTAPGALAPSRLTVAIQRQLTCTLEGAYGDLAHGEFPALRYLRVLASIPGGLDVFVEWSDSLDDEVFMLHATRLHITPERLRVVADLQFDITDGASAESFHDTRLDVDGDGLRDVLMTLGQLAPGDHQQAFVFVASRPGGISRVAIPNDSEALLDGCFLPAETIPTLLLMETQRDAELGWLSSCVALHQFPAFERESVAPITYTLGPRLAADDVIPTLPPGGVPVVSERERPYVPGAVPVGEEARRLVDHDWLPFTMCPEHPVFLLRGHDGEEHVVQTVANVARSDHGNVGPGLSPTPGVLRCEDFE
jgi:hypothetical protein